MGAQRGLKRWVDQVLAFWFDELDPSDWFRVNSAVDEAIAQRFTDLHFELSGTPIETFLRGHNEMLASVVVLDQFSRNLFRNSSQAFSGDEQALSIAREAILRGLDKEVPASKRVFVYLPFEHSEDLLDQELAVEFISTLGNEVQTRYAHEHRMVISTFGRFPHRNEVLGRISTPSELEYLAQPGSGF